MRMTDHDTKGARRVWVRPTLNRLRTADAEISTRVTSSDGGFTNAS